ncbi:hypothetical protein ACP4OV_024898 [Aristida adscensionis]
MAPPPASSTTPVSSGKKRGPKPRSVGPDPEEEEPSPVEWLFLAALQGDIDFFEEMLLVLDNCEGRLREVMAEAARLHQGMGALHMAAAGVRAGSDCLKMCRYLVEELRMDVDTVDHAVTIPSADCLLSNTPLISAVLHENVAVLRYLLDCGANPDKVDNEGRCPLHIAVGTGNCEMVKLLLAKGAYIDPLSNDGTPLHVAAGKGKAGAMKILLDHDADCNKTYVKRGVDGMTPLWTAMNAKSLECVKLLVDAGADVNLDCISNALIDFSLGNDASTECFNFLLETVANRKIPDDDGHVDRRKIAVLMSLANNAVVENNYLSASTLYSKAMDIRPDDAILLSNRSLCWLLMGNGQKALLDATKCRKIWPNLPKAYYRQGTALMLLKEYEKACEAFFHGFKLDPKSDEIELALREAMESMKNSLSTKLLEDHAEEEGPKQQGGSVVNGIF